MCKYLILPKKKHSQNKSEPFNFIMGPPHYDPLTEGMILCGLMLPYTVFCLPSGSTNYRIKHSLNYH